MARFFLVLLALLIFIVPVDTLARSGEHHGRPTFQVGSYRNGASGAHGFKKTVRVKRSKDGKIARSHEAKAQFLRETGYPKGRPGYVVDHIIPLKRGGKDAPSNMQWQTKTAAKAKDKWE